MRRNFPRGYALRAWCADDVSRLISIERAADALFAQHGYAAIAEEASRQPAEMAKFLEGKDILVVSNGVDIACGFTVAGDVGGCHWLYQIAVHPEHGRMGVGTALLIACLEQGRRRGYALAALSTFRHVPFNAPFYERHGFGEWPLAAAPPEIQAQFEREVPPGIDASDRLLMVSRLQ